MAFSLKQNENKKEYRYPDTYDVFKEDQKKAHKEGLKKGQDLFQNYMPKECVELLQKKNKLLGSAILVH